MRKLLVPAWYLPNGTKNALELELEDASSSCERWAIWCGALVVVAVIAELIVSWLKPPYEMFLTESAIADAAIAIGIVGEVLFGMWDGRIQTELRKRSNDRLAIAEVGAAEANKIAAQATKDAAEARERAAAVESLTAWRRIAPEMHRQLVEAIRPHAKALDIVIEYERGDAETFSYAREIGGVFADSGAERFRFDANSWLQSGAFGLAISTGLALDPSPVVDAFRNAGLSPQHFSTDISRVRSSAEPIPNLYIFVAPKPPPAPPWQAGEPSI